MSKKLLSPITFAGLELKNRIALSPMTRARTGESQIPNAANVKYYVQRASAGLLITEGTIISAQGMGWAHAPAIYTPEHVSGWKAVTSEVHKAGGVIFCQLWHLGRVSHSTYGNLPVAPSAIPAVGYGVYGADFEKHPYETPHALTTEEVAGVVQDFKHAAACALEAGFDGVEIHGGNGYLVDQFFQSRSNTREDQYGGSFENRFRFAKEIIEAVSTVYPSNRVAIRLSPQTNFNDTGAEDNFDAFCYYIAELDKLNISFLDICDGMAFGFHDKCAPVTLADARKLFKGIIIGNCGYTAETAEDAVNSGNADMISFGRPYLSNPDLVERFTNGWALAPTSDPSTWFKPPYVDVEKDYVDFPTYVAGVESTA